MSIDYDHSKNLHSVAGPKTALSLLFPNGVPKRILDVGCGTGTWLRAAIDLGATEVFGIDGVDTSKALLFDPNQFKKVDLSLPVNLGRMFDLVLCLEVAEHLDAKIAPTLIETLSKHSDAVAFSAACPGQPGQHHVNCQWPEYWQRLFNARGFVCEDSLRWAIWSVKSIEPWYRQNLFLARRDENRAGREARIPAAILPDYAETVTELSIRARHLSDVEKGAMPIGWYFLTIATGLWGKLRRRILKSDAAGNAR